jgi:antitoxin component YwqK of YwqJK toxin-antitoxin module
MYLGTVFDLQYDSEPTVTSRPEYFWDVAGILRRFCISTRIPCDLVHFIIEYIFASENTYYQSGCVQQCTSFMFDMKHGTEIKYFDNEMNSVQSMQVYMYGKLNGLSCTVNELYHRHLSYPVMLYTTETYVQGKLDGYKKIYCLTGNLKIGYKPDSLYYTGMYSHDVPVGLHTTYVMFSDRVYETTEYSSQGEKLVSCKYWTRNGLQNTMCSKITFQSSGSCLEEYYPQVQS